jgi:hypothetical protein
MFKKMIAILALMAAGTAAYAEDKIELGYLLRMLPYLQP